MLKYLCVDLVTPCGLRKGMTRSKCRLIPRMSFNDRSQSQFQTLHTARIQLPIGVRAPPHPTEGGYVLFAPQ